MAKQQDPNKKAEEIKNSFEDVTLSIKDLEKELSKVFNTKKLDNFVKSLTSGFEESIDYSDKIQDKMTDTSKSVTSLSKEFGSLRGELNSFSKDISNIKVPTLNITSNIQELELPNFDNITLNAKLNKIDLSELDEMPISELMAEIGLIDTSLLDKTIDKYNPIILSSIIDTPDVSQLGNIAKNAPSIQLSTEINTSNATAAVQDQANATNEVTTNIIGTTKALDKMQKKYDTIIKKINEGGKASKSESQFLTNYSKNITATIQDSTSAQNEFQKTIQQTTDGQKKFNQIAIELSTYDGPRFKATGLITKELSKQLSASEMINKSKSSLNTLDATSIGYSTYLADSSDELVRMDKARINANIELSNIKGNINSLSGELIGLMRDESVLGDLLAENESSRFDLVRKINEASDPSERIKLEDILLVSMQEGLDIEKELLQNKNTQKSINDSLQTSLETQANLTSYLNVLAEDQANTEKDVAIQRAIATDETGKLKSALESIVKINNDQITLQGDLSKKMKEVEDSAYMVGTAQYNSIDLADEINEKLEEQRELEIALASILDTNNNLTAEQRVEAEQLVQANIRINQEQLKQAQALQAASEAYATVNDKAGALRDSMMAPIDKLFGIVPSGLAKQLGLDKIQSEMKDKLFKSISDGFMGASGGVSGFFSAASAGASTLMASLAPILPLLLAIAAVVGLVKLFMDADKAVGQLSKDLGVSYTEATKIQGTATDIANEMNVVGINTAEVTKQMVDLKAATGLNFGILAQTNDKAKGLLETSSLLSAQFGTTVEENLALNSAAAITGTTLDKMALTAMNLGDEFVSSGELMKDIGKVSKGVLFNFKGNVKALAQAVKQAKLMGTTLDKMSAVGENLMNIETQIAAQNKARVMLGKNINMDAARYFYMTGDTAKMMDAMVQQMGSAAEYEKLGPYQRKLYAEAMGMGVDQLDEMMAKQLELESMGIDQTKLQEILNKDKEGSLDLEKELAGLKDDEARKMLKQKIEEQRRAGVQEKLADTMQKVTGLLFKIIEPLLPMVDTFVDSLGDGKGILSGMSKVFGVIGSVLGTIMEISMAILKGAWIPIGFTIDLISAAFNKLSKLVKYIKEDIFGMKDATGEAGKAAEGTSKAMEVIKGIATAIGVIIGLWFAGKMIGKAVDGFKSMSTSIKDTYSSTKDMGKDLIDSAKGFKEGMKSAGDEGKGLFGKLKAGFSGMKKKSPVEEVTKKGAEKIEAPEADTKGAEKTLKNTTSFADKLKSAFKSINNTLKSIFKGIGDMLKNIFTFIKDTVKTILDFIKNVMKDIFKTIKDVAKELTSTLQSLMQNIGELLNTAIDVIKDVGTNLIGAVGELLGEVIGVIDEQGTALVEALGNIGNTLAEQVMKIVNTILDGLGQAASKLPNIMGSIGDAIASFFQSLGKISFSEILKGALVMGVLAGTLFLLGKALGTFADVSWDDIGKAAVAMIGLGAAMAILGAAISFIAPGAAALALMAGALYLFGKALQEVAEGADGASKLLTAVFEGLGTVIESIGNAIATVVTAIAASIATLGQVDAGNLAAVGGALVVLGAGLLALTAGEVVNGIASFFGASPVDTLKELETIDGNKMKVTADGLKSMSDALTNFGNVNTDPIVKSADALDKFNNQVIKGGLADGLNSFLGTDPFAVFTQLAAIDTGKIDTVAKSIALAGTSIESFNAKVGALDDSVGDKGDLIAALLNDIADIEHDEIDALATAIDNLAKSYDSLLASMKNITDDDISRMQQIASATPKDVGGGGLGGTLSSAMSGVTDLASNAISSVGSFFGFGDEEEPKQEMQVTQSKPTITPVMQEPHTITSAVPVNTVEQRPAAASTTDNKNVEALLKELISKVSQPVQIKIGDGPLRDIQSAISLSKSYTANINGFR
jgi:phage-related protein